MSVAYSRAPADAASLATPMTRTKQTPASSAPRGIAVAAWPGAAASGCTAPNERSEIAPHGGLGRVDLSVRARREHLDAVAACPSANGEARRSRKGAIHGQVSRQRGEGAREVGAAWRPRFVLRSRNVSPVTHSLVDNAATPAVSAELSTLIADSRSGVTPIGAPYPLVGRRGAGAGCEHRASP
jgi:hypothetical protein